MTDATDSVQHGQLLAANQSVSTLFRDLVDEFAARGVDVQLLAGMVEMQEGYTPKFTWIRGCPLRKRPAWKRLWSWGLFTLQAMVAMIRRRYRLALLVSNPPLVPWVAPLMRALFGVRYAVLIYDVWPDALVRLNLIKENGLTHRFFRRLAAWSHRRAECIITLGECMKKTLQAHVDDPPALTVHVISNWADVESIVPMPRALNPFAAAHGLRDKMVVMYSGAFGATHDIDTIVLAAERLADLPDLRIVLIGGGTREAEVRRLVEEKHLPNLLLLPWQPVERVRYSLTSADCHIVCLDEGYEGVSVPSKTYTSLAAGAALLAVSPADTELANIVSRHDCGIWIRPRDIDGLTGAIRRLHQDRALLARMKANARQAAVEHYSTRHCVEQYVRLLMPLLQKRR